MENQITIREAITENDVALFWEQLHTYYKRDMFPDPNAEERDYFLGDEYRSTMQEIHDRTQDRCYYLFFQRNGQDIGFALPVNYTSEDGKCFIMEFCVYPEYRGNATGKECAKVLLNWAEENCALYAELNYGGNERRLRFWKSVGFIENGVVYWVVAAAIFLCWSFITNDWQHSWIVWPVAGVLFVAVMMICNLLVDKECS